MCWSILRLLGKGVLTPAEKAILAAVQHELAGMAGDLLSQQVAHIGYVQRLLDWTEVSFYPRRRGGDWPAGSLFPNRSELRLAQVAFEAHKKEFQTSVYSVGGHVFSLVTRPSMKCVARTVPHILAVTMLADPLGLEKHAPADDELPLSYLAYLDAMGSGVRGGWAIMSREELYRVHLFDRDYWVLACLNGEYYLLAAPGADGAQLYYSRFDEPPICQARSFQESLSRKGSDFSHCSSSTAVSTWS
jgi:hypothetical protein